MQLELHQQKVLEYILWELFYSETQWPFRHKERTQKRFLEWLLEKQFISKEHFENQISLLNNK